MGDFFFIRRENWTHKETPEMCMLEERPCEETVRRGTFARQGKGRRKTNLLTP